MKTVSIKPYEFASLNDDAKRKALQENCAINVFDDWYDFVYDDFVNIANTVGVAVNRKSICFRGFYSQGDGSAFEASVSIPALWIGIARQSWKSCAPELELDLRPPGTKTRLLKLPTDTNQGCNGIISQPSKGYDVSASLDTDLPGNRHHRANIENELGKLEGWFNEVAKTLNNYLYKSLRDEYEYQTSDNAVIEAFETNAHSFTADGKIATRIERLAEYEQQTNLKSL